MFSFQEFRYDLAKHPNLNEWYKRCQVLTGFKENVEGAKYLAEKILSALDDSF